jgi:hypothetical protein
MLHETSSFTFAVGKIATSHYWGLEIERTLASSMDRTYKTLAGPLKTRERIPAVAAEALAVLNRHVVCTEP